VPISKALEAPLRRMQAEALDPKMGNVLDSPAPVHELIDRIAKNAGVPQATPNVFRHTAATYMARSGVPL
jgi:integrase